MLALVRSYFKAFTGEIRKILVIYIMIIEVRDKARIWQVSAR